MLLKSLLQTIGLLLPALIPSWRFFDEIAPSPRIEYALLEHESEEDRVWQEVKPRPSHISFGRMLRRMIWNPSWNETLFLMSCAERLMAQPTDHSHQEILKRTRRWLLMQGTDPVKTPYLQFRLVFRARLEEEIEQVIAYQSPVHPLTEPGA